MSASQLISLIDNTRLELDNDEKAIENLTVEATKTPMTAAVCVYPKFVALAKKGVAGTSVKVATVVNFPSGEESLESVLQDTRTSLDAGADEVDLVINYKKLIKAAKENEEAFANALKETTDLVKTVKTACGTAHLKVIIESGVLAEEKLIAAAAKAAIDGDCDFVKTSTGKVPVNATLDAAKTILTTIKNSGRKNLGFKAAGGIRTPEQAREFFQLAESIMGDGWVKPDTFRFGASSLLGALRKEIA